MHQTANRFIYNQPGFLLFLLMVPFMLSTGCRPLYFSESSFHESRNWLLTGRQNSLLEVNGTSINSVDSSFTAYWQTYEDSIAGRDTRQLAYLTEPLTQIGPDQPVAHLFADALRFRAARELRKEVDIALVPMNYIADLPDSTIISPRQVKQMIPFDDALVAIEMEGKEIFKLAGQIAEMGGIPMSGMRMEISSAGTPDDILINAYTVDSTATYSICIPVGMLITGKPLPYLKEYRAYRALNVTAGRALMDYFKNRRQIIPMDDQRLRLVPAATKDGDG